jgi:gliding motility-associated-like protein
MSNTIKTFQLELIIILFLFLFHQTLSGQVLHNNGAKVIMQPGVNMFVIGTAQNSSNGVISVQEAAGLSAELIITNNFINNAVAGGDGNFRVAGDWLNNNTFNAGTGNVYLNGAEQIIGGTASTSFYNLFLEGTGNKTQTINQTVTNILNLGDRELLTQQFSMFVTNTNPSAIVFTTGFVSSLQNGFLSRNTASTNTYLFPVGSSVGTFRYGPVEIIPENNSASTYTIRMANVDATTEGFDRNSVASDICQTNALFYHRINRTAGTTPVQMNIYFDENTDGSWEGIANWTANPNQWEIIIGSTSTPTSPLSYAQANNWNTFTQTPYILYNSNPIAQIDAAGPFCINDTNVSLNANPAGGTWNGNGITDVNIGTFDPAIAGVGNHVITYTVGTGSCIVTEQITITVNPLPDIAITAVSVQCENGNTITLEALPSGGLWSGNGIVNASNGIFDPSVAGIGTHTIVYQVTELCTAQESITITVVSAPAITISGIKESCTGALDGSLTTSVSGGTTPFDYIWNTGDTSPNITNAGTGTYSVTVSDNNGCSSSNSFVLQDPNIPCLIYPNHIYVPNVFSPNNDGQNDILFVRGENVSSIEFIIYNRWGNKIFESTSLSNGWDGTYNGKPADSCVYVYVVKGLYINGEEYQDTGNFTLVR